MKKQDLIIKIVNYKGRISSKWTLPKTHHGAVRSAIKLLRFYYRCKNAGLLIPSLVQSLKKVVDIYLEKWSYTILAVPELATMFNEIKNLKVENEQDFAVVEEKIRQRTITYCSLCGTKLVYPAYVVKRKGLEIIEKSSPVGIRCLNCHIAHLNDLVKTVEVSQSSFEQYNESNSNTKIHSQSQQLLLF
jgi:transcription elongation factor Elf1